MTGYVALGSNLGDRLDHLRRGVHGIRAAGVRLGRLSSVWETEPVGTREPRWFLNMAAEIEVARCSAFELLRRLQAVEQAAGRRRREPNGPRSLDLDLLWLDGTTVRTPQLELPHPRMWERSFVLEPLAEIAPHLVRASNGRTVLAERERLRGTSRVSRLGPLGILLALDPAGTASTRSGAMRVSTPGSNEVQIDRG